MFEFIQKHLLCFRDSPTNQGSNNAPQVLKSTCPHCNKLFAENVLRCHMEQECSLKTQTEKIRPEAPSRPYTHLNSNKTKVISVKPEPLGIHANRKLNENFLNEDEVFSGFSLDDLVSRIKQLNKEERAQVERRFIERYYERDTLDCFLIDKSWLQEYLDFIMRSPKKDIKPINNSAAAMYLQTKHQENYYVTINHIAWEFVLRLYGGGPELNVVEDDLFSEADNSFEAVDNSEVDNQSSTAASRKDSKSSSLYETQESSSKRVAPFGLSNELYYCYLNAVMQCLTNLVPFCEEVQASTKIKSGKWTKAFYELASANPKMNSAMNAKNLKRLANNTFCHEDQHDSHEFMRHMLSKIQDEKNTIPAKRQKELNFADSKSAWAHYVKHFNSCVDKTFAGQIESKVFCKSCGGVSTTYDPILDLSLPLTGNSEKLEDCINNFFKEEALPDTYRCEKCKRTTKAVKKMRISKLPNVAVLHLKRFRTYPKQKKISDHVSFPVDHLTFKKTADSCLESNRYSLRGIVVHSGSFSSGHYVSYIKRQNEWYLCDDEFVRKASAKEVASKEAYILFYQRIE